MTAAHRKRFRHVLMAQDWSAHAFDVGFARYAREASWLVDRGMHFLEEFSDWSRWDGIVVWFYHHESQLVKRLRRCRTPVVNIRSVPKVERWVQVRCDNDAIGTQVADYFVERGFERFLYITSHRQGSFQERGEAFERRVLERGGNVVAAEYEQNPRLSQSEGMIAFLRKCLAKQVFPLAVFAANDMLASFVVDACVMLGLDVPTQVAVVGVDNDELFNELTPIPLSSMDPNHAKHGWIAAQTLDRMMNGDGPDGPVLIPPTGIVTRRSSDVLAVEDDGLRKAVAFIAEHYAEPIHVGDIAQASGLSRRLLQSRFREQLKRTVQDELTRLRVDHASRMLRETNHKVEYIGAISGLSNGERLSRVFKRHFGYGPQEYRLRHGR